MKTNFMHEMSLLENLTTILLYLLVLIYPAIVLPATTIAQDPSLLPNQTLFSYSRKHFTQADYYQYVSLSGHASINNGGLQLTYDSINDNFTLFHKSGRAMLRRSFKIWSTKNNIILSFNTTFLFNMYPTRIGPNTLEKAPGEGLAFVIAPDIETPPNSSDRFLGLTNSTHDGNPLNRFIAIELDTVKENENDDPNNNHMGLNINSVRSIKTVDNLSEYNIVSDKNKRFVI